jgi:hypothetical protein
MGAVVINSEEVMGRNHAEVGNQRWQWERCLENATREVVCLKCGACCLVTHRARLARSCEWKRSLHHQ